MKSECNFLLRFFIQHLPEYVALQGETQRFTDFITFEGILFGLPCFPLQIFLFFSSSQPGHCFECDEKDEMIARLCNQHRDQLQATSQQLISRDNTISEMQTALTRRERELADRDSVIADRDAVIAGLDAALTEKDTALSQNEATLRNTRAEVQSEKYFSFLACYLPLYFFLSVSLSFLQF